MKKIVALFAIVATTMLVSCGNGNEKTNETVTDSTEVVVDSVGVETTSVDSVKTEVTEVEEVK